ncbi:MAG: TIGR03619 family F420-dependent LLM class oxidoreductase, partial [Ilumatobacteraceae bacterium]
PPPPPPHANREPQLWGPYTEHDAFHEPFVLFGHLAAVTTSIELVVGVLVAPQRQTALVAKQAAEVAVLSGHRLRLGMGTGWNWVEYESLGASYATRARRLDEQVEVLRRLWSTPTVTFHGEFHDIERAGILPRPETPIPIWFGGGAAPMLRRAARLGDGFIFGHAGGRARDAIGVLRAELAACGRDTGEFGFEGLVDWSIGVEGCIDVADAWARADGTHLSLRTFDTAAEFMGVRPSGFSTVDQHLEALGSFVAAVGGR